MDIFKLFFTHDLPLDQLASKDGKQPKNRATDELSAFTSPQFTYSKFYITGTLLQEERFGLNQLEKVGPILQQLDQVFSKRKIYCQNGSYNSISSALASTPVEAIMIASQDPADFSFDKLYTSEDLHLKYNGTMLQNLLKDGAYILFKERSHHGYDLYLLSLENIYHNLFNAWKPLVDDEFRFFSVNSNRMRTERHYYFETWRLYRPPHGAEEVRPETVL